MKPRVLYALVSMLFAGATSMLAKAGLRGISGEMGLGVRTAFVFVLVALPVGPAVSREGCEALDRRSLTWLGLSAATTALW